MNLQFSRFSLTTTILSGTVMAAAIVITQPAEAKSGKEVAKIAVPTTVRIDNLLSPEKGGSGVIIAKSGNTYTVLTANHVVENPNSQYAIYTSKKKTYSVKEIKSLQGTPNGPDLAIVIFDSPEEQAVAPITNSDDASIGSGVYIAGYPLPGDGSVEREFEFTSGQVTSRPSNKPQGYTMRYDGVTRRGMSGGPVFDVSGRLVGIHGQGDRESGIVKLEGANGQNSNAEIKTGLNAAIPINTFTALMSQVGMNPTALAVDNKPAADEMAVKPTKEEVRSWEQEFAMGVGFGLIQRILPIPAGIPSIFGF